MATFRARVVPPRFGWTVQDLEFGSWNLVFAGKAMATGQLNLVLRHIRKMVGDAPGEGTDQELLERFAQLHEEAVFEILMQRHGPMVWGVSQRVLCHEQDAEDVFQATFLVLARKAESIRKRGSLASWLYGVAYRLALKLRATAAKRRARERRVAVMASTNTPGEVAVESSWSDLRPILDEELSSLPEKYRAPLILCYLEGKTNVEAGRLLGWPAGSMSKRLARGRELLRARLSQRGLALSAAGLAALVSEHTQAAVPTALWQSSLKAAVLVAAGNTLAGVVSTQVATLVHGVIYTMFMTKIKTAAVLFVGVGLLAMTAKFALQPIATATPENPVQEATAGGGSGPAESQPDLALVPGNALGFARLAVHDLWMLDSMKNNREQLARNEGFQDIEKALGFAVADIQTVTFIMIPEADLSPPEPVVLTAIATLRPFDREKLLNALVPEPQEQHRQGKTFFVSKKSNFRPAVHLAGDRLVLLGDTNALKSYFDRLGWAPASNPLSPALKLAEQKHALVAGFQVSDQLHELLTKSRDRNAEFLQPLLDVQSGTLVADVNQEARLKAQLHFANERTAKEARNALAVGLDMVKRLVAAPAEELKNDELFRTLAKEVTAALESAQLSQEKTTVQVTMEAKSLPFISLAVPAVQKTRIASRRMQSQNNLKQIALAMHNYHDTFGRFPPQALTDRNGKPTLSWRVAILPFIEQDNLYKQFKLDEPWDSEHNKKLLERMPQVYASVNANTKEKFETFYQGFAGKGTVFEPGEKITFAQIVDGTSNTLMAVEAGDAVPWTKPEDITFDAEKPLPKLGGEFPDIINAAFCDGSVHTIDKKKLDDKLLRLFILRNSGQPKNTDAIFR